MGQVFVTYIVHGSGVCNVHNAGVSCIQHTVCRSSICNVPNAGVSGIIKSTGGQYLKYRNNECVMYRESIVCYGRRAGVKCMQRTGGQLYMCIGQ